MVLWSTNFNREKNIRGANVATQKRNRFVISCRTKEQAWSQPILRYHKLEKFGFACASKPKFHRTAMVHTTN